MIRLFQPPSILFLGAALIWTGGLQEDTLGEDKLLVIAGGHQAANNQVSLEKNALFFRKVAAEVAPAAGLTEFFSSGNEKIRSVQFESEAADLPKANVYMARLFGSTRYLKLQYREHQLGEVDGITSPTNVNRWFDKYGKELEPGDRLVIYATAHGGRSSDKKKPDNTRIYLWKRQTLDVRGLQANLKKLPEGVSVVLVMAQCFSGGFAHTIFNETDAKSGAFDRPVCGFFATVSSRESAGCTPDINEENYDEFSSHFWAAIRGETRMGKSVREADYDKDGQVSFDEAQAYTILTSRNIDIPMKTSGAFLRQRSRYREDKGEKKEKLLSRRTPFSKVLKLAGPVDRAVLEGLSARLSLEGESRYADGEKKAAEIEKKRADLKKQFDAKKRISDGHRSAIRDTLLGRWPELSNQHTEQSAALLSTQSEKFVSVVEEHPRLKSWNQIEEERKTIDEERFKLEKEWAHRLRFLRAHNNVVLAENLKILGNSDDLARFDAIREAEKGTLGSLRTPAGEKESASGAE